MVSITGEVYKRRFVNAMIQGAAKTCNHMFHMVNNELEDIDPKLSNLYKKMMTSADYVYYVIPKMENGINGGVVKVTFPTKDNSKILIEAEAMVFPVLIHELVKVLWKYYQLVVYLRVKWVNMLLVLIFS
jgi:hypothetical protein